MVHKIIAWGHKRVVTRLLSIETHYYQKCKCGFKATSPSKKLVQEAVDIHLEGRNGSTA